MAKIDELKKDAPELSSIEKLEPCPYCGGEATIIPVQIAKCKKTFFYVVCVQCTAASAPFSTPEAAAAAWNQRV